MHFRHFVLLMFVPLLFCILPQCSSANERPNVLLITADDLGLQLSCYGDATIATPHMDQLAASGVRFETAYVSQASCSPSRSTIFTGMYPHGNGHYGLANAQAGFRVHQELVERLLPNVLRSAGYRTGIIGKLHVNPENAFQFDFRKNEGFGSREIEKQVGFAKEFVSSSDSPWFLMFNLFDPHVARKRLEGGRRGPQYFPDQVLGLPSNPLTAEDVEAWPWQGIDGAEQLKKVAGYYNCVRRVDAAVGMLMKELEQLGATENTLVLLVGDHGPPFARGKTSCYESGLRVPFLARWPSLTPAGAEATSPRRDYVSEKLVGTIDIYPTILDAAGIDLPKGLHGKSLRPILSGQHVAHWRSTLVGEFHFHGAEPFFPRRAITDGRFKLIRNMRAGELKASYSIDGDRAYQKSQESTVPSSVRQAFERLANPPEWEFYDLEQDPHEFTNLAGRDEFETRKRLLILQSELARWQVETADPFVDPSFADQVLSDIKAFRRSQK